MRSYPRSTVPSSIRTFLILSCGVLFLFGLGGFANTCRAEAHWYWQNPVPTGNNLHGVHFVNQNLGWAVGEYGEVFKTTNGGATWNFQRVGTTVGSNREPSFSSVYFLTEEMGWIAGSSHGGAPVILKTTDGGAHWTTQRTGPSSVLSIQFIDRRTGWAIERGPSTTTILKSNDGGATWAPVFTESFVLTHLFFIDPEIGWAVGLGGRILKTTDGGANWNYQLSGTGQGLSSVHFISAGRGWAVGYNPASPPTPSTILVTEDGGTHWQAQNSGTSYPLHSVHFADEDNGWVVGGDSYHSLILKTYNGGKTWACQVFQGNGSKALLSVSFANQNNGLAVGYTGAVFTTVDGGENWTGFSGTRGGLGAIQMVDGNTGWAAGGEGSDGVILKTTNGGTDWNVERIGPSLVALSFLDQNTGWIVGADGVILATNDGGANWMSQKSGTSSHLLGVQFIQGTDIGRSKEPLGWAVGYDGVILHTQDGGEEWNPQTSGVTDTLNAVYFVDQNIGWAVGGFGSVFMPGRTILKTTDGGQNWTIQFRALGFSGLNAVYFLDQYLGWAVGDDGTILKTINGGQLWTSLPSATGYDLHAVRFTSSTMGWAVGDYGTMVETGDGGATWTPHPRIFTEQFLGISFTDANTAWVAGSNGAILHATCIQCSN